MTIKIPSRVYEIFFFSIKESYLVSLLLMWEGKNQTRIGNQVSYSFTLSLNFLTTSFGEMDRKSTESSQEHGGPYILISWGKSMLLLWQLIFLVCKGLQCRK